jgi:hypothetical protein
MGSIGFLFEIKTKLVFDCVRMIYLLNVSFQSMISYAVKSYCFSFSSRHAVTNTGDLC